MEKGRMYKKEVPKHKCEQLRKGGLRHLDIKIDSYYLESNTKVQFSIID
jgi:hypothetical protein